MMQKYFGCGSFIISDLPIDESSENAVTIQYATTEIRYEREFTEYDTLNGDSHVGNKRWWRGYCSVTMFNTADGDGENWVGIAALLSNNKYLYISPRFNEDQSQNLEMYVKCASDFDPTVFNSSCNSVQQLDLSFKCHNITDSIPQILHYPDDETFDILTGEDSDSAIIDGDGNTLIWS